MIASRFSVLQLLTVALWIALVYRPSCCMFPEELDVECLRSSDPDLEKELRLEAVKHEILLRLGLNAAPPNPPPNDTPDPVILEEYKAVQKAQELNNDGEVCAKVEDDTSERELKVFFPTNVTEGYPIVHPSDPTLSTPEFADHYRMKFNLNMNVASHTTNAELRFFKMPRPGLDISQVSFPYDRVEVYSISRPENYYGEERRIFINAKHLDPNREEYTIFDVFKAIELWLEDQQEEDALELEILIRCPEALRQGVSFKPNIQFVPSTTMTQLVVTTHEDNNDTRRKRQLSAIHPRYCHRNPQTLRCCIRPLEINFEKQFNWTWIVEPTTIPFNYCKGVCPTGWAHVYRHTEFITLLRERRNNPTAAPEPCCVANSYEKNVTMLTYIEGEYIMQVLHDVIIKTCECR